jgi:hypothetical protein
MIFSLEALEAKKGDSLILHVGSKEKPRLILIDGGPSGVYRGTLEKRLEELRGKFPDSDGRLRLDMVMVSHIDDDHIKGILDLFGDLENAKAAGDELPYRIKTLWFNSFDESLGNLGEELETELASVQPGNFGGSGKGKSVGELVVAGVTQGRNLRAAADRLAIAPNLGFTGPVMTPGVGSAFTLNVAPKLKFTIIGPSKKRLQALGKKWETEVKNNPDAVKVAEFLDKSVANLSSIVVLAKCEGKTMLLTGDARGDDVWEGLEEAGLLTDKKLHVDLLKMPHHGSSRNMRQDFLEHITADHYVFSADGEHDNPDAETVEMLCKARGAAAYSVYFTNEKMINPDKSGAAADVEAQVKAVLANFPSAQRKVVFRADGNPSVIVNLSEEVDY